MNTAISNQFGSEARAVIHAAGNAARGSGSLPLNPARIAKDVVVIVGLLLLNKAGSPGAAAFFLILLGMVFYSPRAAFKAIAICSLGLMIHQILVPKTIIWTPGRLVLPFVAFVRFYVDLLALGKTPFSTRWYPAFLVYVLAMAGCSLASGWYTQIALLKLFNFWVVMTAVFSGVLVLRAKRIDLTEWFVSLIAATAFFGAVSIVTGISYSYFRGTLLTSEKFVGAFLHPNCHSLYGAIFITFLASVWVIGAYRKAWFAFPWIVVWAVFIVLSKARTSVLATGIGLAVLFLYVRPLRNRLGDRLRINVRKSTIAIVGVAAVLGLSLYDISSGGSIRKSIVEFVNKEGEIEGDADFDSDQIIKSRIGLIEFSWNNFLEHPVFGIGFQVAMTADFVKNATLFSAPAEKGFLPTAVLEEGGVVGATAFVLFLGSLLAEMVRGKNVPALAVMAAFLAANMTEVSIFSPGGSGAFGWTMVGAAMILGDHCWVPGSRSQKRIAINAPPA